MEREVNGCTSAAERTVTRVTGIQAIEQQRVFVGRQREMRILEDWIQDSDSPTQVVSICGMGGIGKSLLMSEMLRLARSHRIFGVWVDGRACIHTPTGFLDHLTTSIMLEYPDAGDPKSALNLLYQATSDTRVILCIDNYESLSGIEGWLIEALLPRFSSCGIFIVLASRPQLSLVWRSNLTWRDRLQELQLENFTRSEIHDYLQRLGHADTDVLSAAVRVSRGHPLALALVAETIQSTISPELETFVAQNVSVALLREFVASDLQAAVDVLTIVSVADHDLLNAILQPPLTAAQYHKLGDLSLIRVTPNGLSLHDVARAHLLHDLGSRQPDYLQSLRSTIARTLIDRFQVHRRTHPESIARQLLTLCLDALPLRSEYADLTVDPKSFHIDSFRESDLTRLHKLLTDWCKYSVDEKDYDKYHQFLDRVANEFPQSVRVIRGADNQPIAMLIINLVYKGTAKLLYQFFPYDMEEFLEPEDMICDAGEADTYYAVLAAFDLDNAEFTGDELVGALMREGLTLLGQGTRNVLIAANAELIKLLTRLGFTRRRTRSPCDALGEEAYVMELDLRNWNFTDWAEWLMREVIEDGPDAPTAVVADITEEMVRDALSKMSYPMDLDDCSLAKVLQCNGQDLLSYLSTALSDRGTERLLSNEQQAVLTAMFVQQAGNAMHAAAACSMSRATFYRHLRAAVQRLKQGIIWSYSERA